MFFLVNLNKRHKRLSIAYTNSHEKDPNSVVFRMVDLEVFDLSPDEIDYLHSFEMSVFFLVQKSEIAVFALLNITRSRFPHLQNIGRLAVPGQSVPLIEVYHKRSPTYRGSTVYNIITPSYFCEF